MGSPEKCGVCGKPRGACLGDFTHVTPTPPAPADDASGAEAMREACINACWRVENALIDAGLKDGTVRRDPHGGYDSSPAMIAVEECVEAIEALPRPARSTKDATRQPGCAPRGNRATVEVVPTVLLDPLDVVWHEDGWHVVIADAGNDESSVTLAPIIDDAGGQGDEVEACAEFFLRCAPLPATDDAVEEARRAMDAAMVETNRLEADPKTRFTGPHGLACANEMEAVKAYRRALLGAALRREKESRSDDSRPASGQGGA